MSPVIAPEQVEAALGQRLRAVATVLDVQTHGSVAQDARALIDRLAESSPRQAWLGFIAFAGVYPTRDELAAFQRAIALSAPEHRLADALATVVAAAGRPGRATREIELVDDPRAVLVDVTFSAANEHNTGVQRVVRSFVPEWVRSGRPVRPVRWSPAGGGYVDLDPIERVRVLDWGAARPPLTAATRPHPRPILVPWGAAVFFPEVLQQGECAEAACLAEYSGSRIGVLGHDTIPISSADTVPEPESERFSKFLDVVKHADFVAGVSRSAANEFAGFVHALPAQGLRGPRVAAVPNAVEPPAGALAAPEPPAEGPGLPPLVLCVGSHEPRKNQDAVFAAAQSLHQQGLVFRMVFVGGGGRQQTAAFDAEVARWQRRGMRVESHRRLADQELWALYKEARFTVLLSLHEGFGLPVAESVALGTPVLTSDFGSLAEVAQGGGCLTVDPRDDDRIIAAMRAMLTDDALIERLRTEAAAAPTRSWAQFADELWHQFNRQDDEELA
jgi:glycosyltransferase involved in cell wall biosynthesis